MLPGYSSKCLSRAKSGLVRRPISHQSKRKKPNNQGLEDSLIRGCRYHNSGAGGRESRVSLVSSQHMVESRSVASLKTALETLNSSASGLFSSMAPSRNLLICFDAFGTLFVPRRPVHQQYGEVAKALGMSGFSDEDIAKTLKAGNEFRSPLTCAATLHSD